LEKYFNDPTVFSEVVTDAQAAQAVVRFAGNVVVAASTLYMDPYGPEVVTYFLALILILY
jgi:hypothetical protein